MHTFKSIGLTINLIISVFEGKFVKKFPLFTIDTVFMANPCRHFLNCLLHSVQWA
jgi:hypothetical protein